MAGGQATNVVTDQVTLRAEARSHDPVFRKRILHEIEEAFRRAAEEVRNVAGQAGGVELESTLDYESFLLPANEPCVAIADAAIRAVGREPERVVASGGLDANWITALGLPAVSLGCGQLNQHMTTEALDIEEFLAACQIALLLAAPRPSDPAAG
jgi:tripeptide aminopeptidase